jgi:phosphohistidine phosphatase
MNVGLFRHGPAVARGTDGVSEADRPLTAEGRKKTTQAARGLRALDLDIDAVFSSPLPRALQTAAIAARILRLPAPRVLEGLSPGGSARRLLESLRNLEADRPLLVGHEPLLSSAVSLAVTGATTGAFELRKAGLAWIELDSSSARPRGVLKLLLTGSALRKLG